MPFFYSIPEIDKITTAIASRRLSSALESNMLALWKGYGRATGCELTEGEGLVRVLTGVPSPLFNGVFRARLAPDGIEQAIMDTLGVAALWDVPLFWWVGSDTEPPDLGRHLERFGFVHVGAAPGMAIELSLFPRDTPPPPHVTIEVVEDEEELDRWARAAVIAAEYPARVREGLIQLERDVGLHPEVSLRRYIGYQDGAAVASSALVLHAGVAGMYAVATLPEARRQGIGAAMTRVPLLDARAEGYRVGTLHASEMGRSLYEGLGFQEVCKTEVYVMER